MVTDASNAVYPLSYQSRYSRGRPIIMIEHFRKDSEFLNLLLLSVSGKWILLLKGIYKDNINPWRYDEQRRIPAGVRFDQYSYLLTLDAPLMSDWLPGNDTQFTYPFHDNGIDDDSDVDSSSSSVCSYFEESNDRWKEQEWCSSI